jgi:hypothetical protein
MAVVLEIIDLLVCRKIHGCGCVADDPLASKSINQLEDTTAMCTSTLSTVLLYPLCQWILSGN